MIAHEGSLNKPGTHAALPDKSAEPSTQTSLEMTLNDDRKAPIRLDYYRLVKRLNEHFVDLPEARIPEDIHEAWAGYFQEMAITQEEIDFIGLWYSRHYSVSLSIPSLNRYLKHLRLHASMPDQRLPGQTETDAGNILKACAALRLDRSSLADGLFLAAALVHHANYRSDCPTVSLEYIRMEIEGRARLADYFSHDILDEAQDGYGAAAHLRKVLFPPRR